MGPHVCDRKEAGGPRPDLPVMLASQVNRHKYASHSLNFTFRVQEMGGSSLWYGPVSFRDVSHLKCCGFEAFCLCV